MDFIILIFSFIGEIVIPFVIELLFWTSTVPETCPKPGKLTFIICVLLGGGIGFLSLFVMKQPLIVSPGLQIVYLIVMPVLVAWGIIQIYRIKNAQRAELYLMENFFSAYAFAMSFAIVRFVSFT